MADRGSPLEREIRRLIAAAGPMPIAEFMRLCLTHPDYGYYVSRDPFGAGGDFITAPEISQMFGELIGLWLASVWQQMGAPENVRVVELGPGRGTLLGDALRATKIVKGFNAAVVLHLVEVSPLLRRIQEERLETLDVPIMWHATFAEVPEGPVLVVANEFLDALPVHQAVKQAGAWHERVVEIGRGGHLSFGIAGEALPFFAGALPRALRQAPDGVIFEWRSDVVALELGRRVRSDGAALILDYGHTRSALGETLQAVAGHAPTDPLRAPGEADLTAHVDFEALATSAEGIGARVHGPMAQRDFLFNLGIRERAATLMAKAPHRTHEIDAALNRLTARETRGMGELFKAIAVADPRLSPLPGFEAPK